MFKKLTNDSRKSLEVAEMEHFAANLREAMINERVDHIFQSDTNFSIDLD